MKPSLKITSLSKMFFGIILPLPNKKTRLKQRHYTGLIIKCPMLCLFLGSWRQVLSPNQRIQRISINAYNFSPISFHPTNLDRSKERLIFPASSSKIRRFTNLFASHEDWTVVSLCVIPKRLAYIVEKFIKLAEWPTLRGVIAYWKNETLCLNFFFEGQISELLKENASILATEILAQFSEGFLKEIYTETTTPEPLPESHFWVYKRLKKGSEVTC